MIDALLKMQLIEETETLLVNVTLTPFVALNFKSVICKSSLLMLVIRCYFHCNAYVIKLPGCLSGNDSISMDNMLLMFRTIELMLRTSKASCKEKE